MKKVLRKLLKIIGINKEIYCTVSLVDCSNRLEGKNVVITGASSGIGAAIAIKASQEGANVLIIGRREEKLRGVKKECGNKCQYLVSDITKDVEILKKCLELFGEKIDILVNNAGIYIQHGEDYTLQEFEKTIDLNLKVPFMLTQEYIGYCKKNRVGGNVLMISSNRGIFGDTTPYGISKAGLNNFVNGFARDNTNSGIRINAICPGMVATEINNVDKKGNMFSGNPRYERVLMPEEIAEVAVFLMSDISQCINGAIIPCDGGDCLR